MKKLLVVLAFAGVFTACNNTSGDAPKTDSPAVAPVDTTAKPVDTTAQAADTTAAAAADTTKK